MGNGGEDARLTARGVRLEPPPDEPGGQRISDMEFDEDTARCTVGMRLRFSRTRLGWSQEEAAARVGIGRVTLTDIENGKRNVTTTELILFCWAYGTEQNLLLCKLAPGEAKPGVNTDPFGDLLGRLSLTDRYTVYEFARFLESRGQTGLPNGPGDREVARVGASAHTHM